ncbi:hypothetical protein Patl1_27932 [Pistacia atlantica]|uniref:Uncharacterized protein n=1 Tax=Pistacia atlantica TaxID=434234 RepID=A0ACC1BGZ5_9ROSI|nr:hypothetical protein Patl1_27932 [Pistacia atlantica]
MIHVFYVFVLMFEITKNCVWVTFTCFMFQVVMPTVEADVAFGLGKFNLTPDEVRSRVSKSLEAVGMSKYMQRPVQTLSGGQKQRVAIAGALAEACKVLLLDELTTFLDENDQFGVIKAVKNSLGDSGDVTALWVTHRLEELEYADGALYMEDGKIVMQGNGIKYNEFHQKATIILYWPDKFLIRTLSLSFLFKLLIFVYVFPHCFPLYSR